VGALVHMNDGQTRTKGERGAEWWDRVRLFFERFLKPDPPKQLYHYTSGAALLAIIDSGALRLSEIRYLNDTAEFSYTLEMVREHLSKLAQSDGDTKALVPALNAAVQVAATTHRFYVGCFSEKGDQLSQWRGYAGPSGFSLGFSTAGLLEAAEKSEHMLNLARCIYDIERQWKILDDATTYLLDDFRELLRRARPRREVLEDIAMAAGDIFSTLATQFKHPAFHEEAEWRLVLRTWSSSSAKPQFRPGTRFLIPYFELSLKDHSSSALETLIVGPTPHPDEALESAAQLFSKLRLDPKCVTRSSLPFRDW